MNTFIISVGVALAYVFIGSVVAHIYDLREERHDDEAPMEIIGIFWPIAVGILICMVPVWLGKAAVGVFSK